MTRENPCVGPKPIVAFAVLIGALFATGLVAPLGARTTEDYSAQTVIGFTCVFFPILLCGTYFCRLRWWDWGLVFALPFWPLLVASWGNPYFAGGPIEIQLAEIFGLLSVMGAAAYAAVLQSERPLSRDRVWAIMRPFVALIVTVAAILLAMLMMHLAAIISPYASPASSCDFLPDLHPRLNPYFIVLYQPVGFLPLFIAATYIMRLRWWDWMIVAVLPLWLPLWSAVLHRFGFVNCYYVDDPYCLMKSGKWTLFYFAWVFFSIAVAAGYAAWLQRRVERTEPPVPSELKESSRATFPGAG